MVRVQVRYTLAESVIPHQNYLYDDGVMEVIDDNGVLLQTVNTSRYRQRYFVPRT